MTERRLQSFQLDTNPGNRLEVLAQDTPNDTVQVQPGYVTLSDGVTPYGIESALDSSAFPVLGAGKVSRWDLLCFDLTGVVPVLKGPADDASLKGTESALTQKWWNSVPEIPDGYMPVAAIHVRSTTTVVVAQSDIEDIRPFFIAPAKIAGSTQYSPSTPANWILTPDNVASGLDEVAERLSNDLDALDVGPSGLAGTSKYAARYDHVHAHANQGNTGSLAWPHRATQVGHRAADVTDWTSGIVESSSKDRLDELAARASILQGAFYHPYIDTVTGDRAAASATWVFTNTRKANLVGSGNEFWYELPSEDYRLESLHVIILDHLNSDYSKHLMSFMREDAFNAGPGANYNGRVVSLNFSALGGGMSTDNDTAVDINIPSAYNPFAFLQLVSVGATWDVKMKHDGDTFYVWLDDTPSNWDTGAGHSAILEARAVFSVDYDDYSP